jgi:putative ABC transport system permease protein
MTTFDRRPPGQTAARAARIVARLYPPGSRARRTDIADFIASMLADRWAARRIPGLASAAVELLADLARAWMGRSALPVNAHRRLSAPSLMAPRWRRSSLMDRLGADLRYSLRTLARTPAFTSMAIVLLALGIGAATSVYAVVDGVLLRPFTYPDMDRIMLVTERGGNGQQMSVSWPNFQDWKENDAFEELGVYRAATVTMTGFDTPERLAGSLVSSSVFATAGIAPLSGRVFTTADDGPGASRAAIISERLWRGRFAARADIIGLPVDLNSEPFTIVGVMPAGMRFPARTTDVWLPLGLFVQTFPNARGAHPGLTAVGRVKPGVTLARAQAQMDAIAQRLGVQFPNSNRGLTAQVASYYELIVQNIRPSLYVLLAAVGLLLVLACSNLASLMLARAEARQRELALRAALGAGRARLARQLFLESLVLAAVGGLAGVGLAWAAVRGFVALRPSTVPRIDLLGVDWRVAAFAVAAAGATAVLCGLLPALRSSAPDLQGHLTDGRGATSRHAVRLRRVLVVGQVAVAAVLLIGAGLLAKSLSRLMELNLGFDPARVVTMRLALPDAAYPTPEAWIAFHRSVIERVGALPGADAIGLNSAVPLEGGGSESPVIKEGSPVPSPDRVATMCLFQTTGGEYFRAMDIPLLRGRVFDARDTTDSTPVAVVDETLAKRLFGDENPIGQRVAFEFSGHDAASGAQPLWREVVGVVQHVKHYGLITEPPYVQIYAPLAQLPIWSRTRRPNMALVVRTAGDPSAIVGAIRRAVADLDGRIPVFGVQPMSQYLGTQTEQYRLSALLMSGFAGLAALIATVGLYGVLAYLVSRRTREIGVRLALGARRADIVKGIVTHGLVLALAGLGIGLATSVGAGRLITALLYDVSPTDAATFAVVGIGLATVAFVASLVPARRASSVDPLVALRRD